MAAQITRLCGQEWQDWANKLLSCHYGPTEYQRIADHDRGDAGLEGFTRTSGHAYQAYGCDEPISTPVRYERQRDKMTQDIGKFITNRVALGRLLGTVSITRWALFVPFSDSKELVAHASKKTEEVLRAQLPYVDKSFHVCVCQEGDFPVARDRLLSASTRGLLVRAAISTPEEIEKWVIENQGPSSTLADKLRRLPTLTDDDARESFHQKVLGWYLEGQEILEALRNYPDVYAKVKQAKSHREGFLAANAIGGAVGHQLFREAVGELRETLEREVRELHIFSSEALSYEAVADWLLRCPLDFPGV